MEKRVAITLCVYGLSLRKIGGLLGYSHVTVLNWVREFEWQTNVPTDDYFLELDELCAFLSERAKNPRMGKRFTTMQEALTWKLENDMAKIFAISLL